MKIETSNKKFAGQSMRLGNETITFDNEGVFEVEKELGLELIEKYDFLFEEGKLPKPKEEKISDQADLETINDLKIKIEQHKATIDKKNKEIALLKEDNQNWRNIADNALKGITTELKNEKGEVIALTQGNLSETDSILNTNDFKAILEGKSFDELKGLLTSMGGTLQGLKTPEQVIKKILALEEQGKEE